MADATERFEETLARLTESTGRSSAAQEDLIKTLLALKKIEKEELDQSKKLQTAREKELEIIRKKEEREQNIIQGLNMLGNGLKQTILSFTAVTSSVYNTDKAFTAVIPVLDNMASIAKTTVSAFGKMASGTSFLGFSFGRLSEGMAELANSGIDVLTGVLKFQLETAQKVADNFVNLAKSGVTFGGSIDRMAAAAAKSGLSIEILSKFLSSNVESLSQLSKGTQDSGIQIATLGREIGQTNRRLLMSYGSYDELNNAILEYVDLQRRVGIDELSNQDSLRKGATAYLEQQKELTALTGKSAEQLKKEQEERRKDTAYQLALNKMSAEERLNAEYAIAQIAAKFGPEAAQYAKEYIATSGQVISKTGLQFEGMLPVVANTVQGVLSNMSQTSEAFKISTNNVISNDAQRNASFAKGVDQLLFAQLVQAGYGNDLLKMMSNVTGTIVSTENAAANAAENKKKLDEENAKGIGAASQNYVNAVNTLIDQQRKIDTIVIGNMEKMSKLVEGLYAVNEKFITATNGINQAINGLVAGSFKNFKEGIDLLTESILGRFGLAGREKGNPIPEPSKEDILSTIRQGLGVNSNAEITPDMEQAQAARLKMESFYRRREQERQRRKNMPQASAAGPVDPLTGTPVGPAVPDVGQNPATKATGGITTGPTIAGEDGPEAVIPLKGGNIPLKIDFDPVVRALQTNSELIERLNRTVEDSKDIQRQILNASY